MSRLLFWRFRSFAQTVAATVAVATWAVPDAAAVSAGNAVATAASASWAVPDATAEPGTVTVAASVATASWTVPLAGTGENQVVSATVATATWTVPAATAYLFVILPKTWDFETDPFTDATLSMYHPEAQRWTADASYQGTYGLELTARPAGTSSVACDFRWVPVSGPFLSVETHARLRNYSGLGPGWSGTPAAVWLEPAFYWADLTYLSFDLFGGDQNWNEPGEPAADGYWHAASWDTDTATAIFLDFGVPLTSWLNVRQTFQWLDPVIIRRLYLDGTLFYTDAITDRGPLPLNRQYVQAELYRCAEGTILDVDAVVVTAVNVVASTAATATWVVPAALTPPSLATAALATWVVPMATARYRHPKVITILPDTRVIAVSRRSHKVMVQAHARRVLVPEDVA